MVISSRCPVQYEEELQSEEESSVAFTANASGQGGWLMVSVQQGLKHRPDADECETGSFTF